MPGRTSVKGGHQYREDTSTERALESGEQQHWKDISIGKISVYGGH